MPVIEFDNVRFSYDDNECALDGMTLSIEQGEFACVLGGNGSGKSTLAKHINALLLPDEGTVTIGGLSTSDPDNTFAIRNLAGMVFQNPDDQIVASVVEDDVAFGPENLGVEPAEIRRRVTHSLARVGLAGFELREIDSLSGGQKQRVAIAGALAMEPSILVLDEASSMLDPIGRRDLMGICRDLNDEGITIVMITHFMEEATFADRVIVVDRGTIALDGAPQDVLTETDELRRLALDVPFAAMASRAMRHHGIDVDIHIDIDSLASDVRSRIGKPKFRSASLSEYSPHDVPNGASPENAPEHDPFRRLEPKAENSRETVDPNCRFAEAPRSSHDSGVEGFSGNTLLSFDNVSFSYETPVASNKRKRRWNSRKASVQSKRRENDRRDADEPAYALRDVSFDLFEGEILGVAGRTGSGKSTLSQLCNGLLQPTSGQVLVRGRALFDKKTAVDARRDIGLVFQYPEHQLFAPTVFDDIAFGPRNLGCSEEDIDARVNEALSSMHLDPKTIRYRNPFSLSGGHQRRVAFAGVLAMRPRVLLLDEPVAGLDPRERESFLLLIDELRREHGLTIVLVSHIMNDLARLCDRIALINDGTLVTIDTPWHVFSDEERLYRCGLDTPDALHLAHELGLRFDHIPTVDEIAHSVSAEGLDNR